MFEFFARSSPPTIRRIGPDSSRDCAAIHAQCFARRWSATEFENLLADRHVIADAAINAATRQMSGFMLSRIAADEAEILTIAVAPARRRKEVAGRLLAHHLGRLAAAGAKTLFLEVDGRNQAALALYTGFGFRQVGTRKAYYQRPGEAGGDALIMRRALG
jgi:[ribosomal protein S18]-alanine N-acetyltransferase